MNRLDKSPLFIFLFIATCTSYLFSMLAFIVSKWYAMYPGSLSEFQNIGLWEVCFSSYMNEDSYDKLYSDCFYINSYEISDLYDWIVQNWFRASQILYTLSFVSLMIASIVCTLMCFGILNMKQWKNTIIVTILHGIAWITCLATLILFGVNTKNMSEYQWMPNPTQCTLSWSFGSAALSLLATMISLGVTFFVFTCRRNKYVNWSCGKSVEYNYPLNDEVVAEKLEPVGTSIYDPRGTNSESRLTTERDRSVISSRLDKPRSQLSKQKVHNPSYSDSSQLQSHSERPRTTRTKPREPSPVKENINRNLYSKNPKKTFSESTLQNEPVRKPAKVTSPAPSQLTVTSRNASSTVIAARPMKRN